MDGMRQANAAEERFVMENGLDLARFLGAPFDERRPDAYSLLPGRVDLTRPVLPQIGCVAIAGKPGRFGNSVIQLTRAFSFCRRNRVPQLLHPGLSWFADDIEIEGVRIRVGNWRQYSDPAPLLAGRFFHKVTLGSLLDPASLYTLLQSLAPGLRFDRAPGAGDVDELCFHIRAGDIFKDDGAHRLYGQPPMAFYRKVLAMHPCSRARLVYEDSGNPCIEALQRLLDERGIPYTTQSTSLREDIECLYRARHLVIGRGTFIQPILCTSLNLQTVYVFEERQQWRVWGLRGVSVRYFEDRSGGYADNLHAWRNTESQRQQMLAYGEENIVEVARPDLKDQARPASAPAS